MASGIISHEHKLIYVPIPKNACTTTKYAMYKLINGEKILPKNIHLAGIFESINPDNYPDYFTFAIIRNPLKRLESCYVNKLVELNREHNVADGIYAPFIKYGCYKGMPFEDFVRIVCNTSPDKAELHFKPQHLFLNCKIDFKINFDNIEGDWETMLKSRDIPHFPLGFYNQTVIKGLYTEELVKMVCDYYAKDFSFFS